MIVLLLTYIALTLLGYAVHYAFHQPWSGRFYSKHLNHHLQQYPPEDFVSDTYRSAGKDNSFYLFLLVFSPLILGVIFLMVVGIMPLLIGISILAEMAIVSFLNNSLHDSYHLTSSVWHRFWFFDRLKKLHYEHHMDMSKNYSIYGWFIWDKVFGTYKEKQ